VTTTQLTTFVPLYNL